MDQTRISGCGIGLRGEFLTQLQRHDWRPDWIEITPENWISIPFEFRKPFEELLEKIPTVAHGLSLSLGSPEPLDLRFLKQLKNFLDHYEIDHYSEHISFSTLKGQQTFELLPVPMTESVARHIARKATDASDFLERKLILENATYYFGYDSEVPEAEFINLILNLSGAELLLDINNVYVNSKNFGFDPLEFIQQLDLEKTAYIHVAGHTFFPEDNLIIDTHGEQVVPEVWKLLEQTLKLTFKPVLLERDNNIPPLDKIISEYGQMKNTFEVNDRTNPFQQEIKRSQ